MKRVINILDDHKQNIKFIKESEQREIVITRKFNKSMDRLQKLI